MRLRIALAAFFLAVTVATVRSYTPVVTMSVTTPDGRTQELTASESGVAWLTVKDGTEYGFRPTIQDSSPYNRIIVTIFRGATATTSTTVLGEVELRRGAPAVDSKTNPSFKISVSRVSEPASQAAPKRDATGR